MKRIELHYGDILNNLGTYYIMEAPKTKNRNRRIMARCGRCGNLFEGFLSNIRKYNAGCPHCRIYNGGRIDYQYGDILNKKTGSIYIEEVDSAFYSHRRALVQCGNCGQVYEACIENVKNGSLCPYCKPSNNSRCVESIQQILDDLSIRYIREYSFSDLLADNGKNRLRFDFAIFMEDKIILLEVDGEQHYRSIAFFGGETSFIQLQKNDKKKNIYARQKGYILIRIPYFDFDRVDKEYILNLFYDRV